MKHRIFLLCLLVQAMVKSSSAITEAMTELADNQSLTFLQTLWVGIMPANYYFVPLLVILGVFFVLLWSKQPFELPAILMMMFLGVFSVLLTEGGFELGVWAFRGVAIAAVMIILLKLFWRD
jgi:hypothetical protein